jgi:hypothetical protein
VLPDRSTVSVTRRPPSSTARRRAADPAGPRVASSLAARPGPGWRRRPPPSGPGPGRGGPGGTAGGGPEPLRAGDGAGQGGRLGQGQPPDRDGKVVLGGGGDAVHTLPDVDLVEVGGQDRVLAGRPRPGPGRHAARPGPSRRRRGAPSGSVAEPAAGRGVGLAAQLPGGRGGRERRRHQPGQGQSAQQQAGRQQERDQPEAPARHLHPDEDRACAARGHRGQCHSGWLDLLGAREMGRCDKFQAAAPRRALVTESATAWSTTRRAWRSAGGAGGWSAASRGAKSRSWTLV